MRSTQLGPLPTALLIYATLPVAYFFSFRDLPVALIAVSAAALLVLLGGLQGRASHILGLGAALLLILLVKDAWPMRADWLVRWSTEAGFRDHGWWYHVRNPQIRSELRQAAVLATALLGITALHSAWARQLISRETWLRLLAATVLVWVLGLLLFTQRTLPYGPGNSLPGVLSKNAAGSLAALGLVLNLGLAIHTWSRPNRAPALGWLAAAALAAWAVLNLNSWTAALGGLAGITVLIVGTVHTRHSRRGATGSLLWILCGLAALVLVVLVLSPTLGARVQAFGGDYRFAIWRDVLRMLAHQPFGGFGLGSFEKIYPLFGQLELPADARLFHPDSSWLLLAIEWGLVPLALLAALGIALGRREPAGAPQPHGTSALTHTVRAATLAWLVCGLTDPALHRPVTAFIGCSLLPFLVPRSADPRRVRWAWPVIVACMGVIALGLRAGHLEDRGELTVVTSMEDLRQDPLNARLHWQLALQAWNQKQDHPLAIAHFRAVVALEHRSTETAELVARLLSESEPAAALFFWQAAFQRGRTDPNRSAGILENALRDFPRFNASYWERVILPAAPDLRLVLATRPDADSERLLRGWLEDGGMARLRNPAAVTLFYRALGRLQTPRHLLAAAVSRQPGAAPREFYLRAAQTFHDANDDERAWQVLLQVDPWSTLNRSSPPAFADPRSTRWVSLLTTAFGTARERMLREICAQTEIRWFHLEWARALHASGKTPEAVAHLLAITPDIPAPVGH